MAEAETVWGKSIIRRLRRFFVHHREKPIYYDISVGSVRSVVIDVFQATMERV